MLLMWNIGFGLVLSASHSPTHLAGKEPFKYFVKFYLFNYSFLAQSHSFGMQLKKCSFDTSPELQHDKSLAVNLLAEIWVISNTDSISISSSLLWKHWIENWQCLRWKLVWTVPAQLTEVHGHSFERKILIFYWSIFHTVVRLHYSPLSSQNPFPPEGKLDLFNYLLPQFFCSVFGMSTIWFRHCTTLLP